MKELLRYAEVYGVLFRGGEEETIRRTLIERNHIEAIIGLPANIFFGTGIPTIIMVLKRKMCWIQ